VRGVTHNLGRIVCGFPGFPPTVELCVQAFSAATLDPPSSVSTPPTLRRNSRKFVPTLVF
jgi:hypothetical protein